MHGQVTGLISFTGLQMERNCALGAEFNKLDLMQLGHTWPGLQGNITDFEVML